MEHKTSIAPVSHQFPKRQIKLRIVPIIIIAWGKLEKSSGQCCIQNTKYFSYAAQTMRSIITDHTTGELILDQQIHWIVDLVL